MRKIYKNRLFILAVSMLTANINNAQNTFPATGNVGIGTVTPKAPLQILGDMIIGNEELGQRFIFHPRPGSSKGDFLQITSDDASGNWEWRKGITFVRSTGNVVIGTANPTQKLSVSGGICTEGWDAILQSRNTSGKVFDLIGTYEGWDPTGVYIAGYNAYNSGGRISSKKVYIGSLAIIWVQTT